jgi:hypothetical protein
MISLETNRGPEHPPAAPAGPWPTTYVHGPERRRARSAVRPLGEAALDPFPYHGIISRGLMEAMTPLGAAGPQQWGFVAPLLEQLLNAREPTAPGALLAGLARCWSIPPEHLPSSAAIGEWLEVARRCGVLSYAESGELARRAALCWLEAHELAPRLEELELWSVKEGHTSSVWRVTATARDRAEPIVFGLNVARDTASGMELKETSTLLSDWHAVLPGRVLGVERVLALPLGGSREPAVVTVVPWVEEAFELSVLPQGSAGSGRFFAVEAFGNPQGWSTGGTQRARVRPFSLAQSDALWRQYVSCRARLTRFDGERRALCPGFELNDGDWIWSPGGPLVVAASQPRAPSSPGEWLLSLLLPSAADARARGRRVYWNRPEAAYALLESIWAPHGAEWPALEACASAAGQIHWSELIELDDLPGRAAFERAQSVLSRATRRRSH